MKRALCTLLLAAAVALPCLMLPAAASVESEPMNASVQSSSQDDDSDNSSSQDDDSDNSSSQDDDSDNSSSQDDDSDNSSSEDDDSDNSSSEDDDSDNSSSEDDDSDNSSSQDDDSDNSSSEDDDSEERPPWWWDEEIDGVWYPGAENTPTASDATLSESVLLQPVVIGDGEIIPNPVFARVTSILSDAALADELFPGRDELSVIFEAQVQEGDFAGTTVSSIQPLDEALSAYGRTVAAGDAIYLTLYREESGTLRGEWSDFYRSPWILGALAAAAVLLLLCTRRWGGFKLLFLLAVSVLAAFKIYPAFLQAGMNAQGAAFLFILLLTFIACPLLYGVKFRTLAATGGSLLSVSTVGLLFYTCSPALRLTGITSIDLLRASFREQLPLYLSAGLTAASMLCTAGAALAASNAAAAGAEPTGGEEITLRQAYLRGYRSGSSALAPLCLALAFFSLGLLLPLLLPMLSAGFSAGRILSDERITTEILRLIASLLGVMLSIPLTSALCALLIPLRRQKEGGLREFHILEALRARQQKLFGRAAAGIDNATLSIARKTDEIDHPQQEQEETEETAESSEAEEKPEE
ncbi:MAG: hypothetical protein HFG27_05995 [Provencibacterium sp.]|nr:hypothetical protein [Provencibacterium sp.]